MWRETFFTQSQVQERKISGYYCRAAGGSGQRAECQPVRYKDGETWFRHFSCRYFFLEGKRRRASQLSVTRPVAETAKALLKKKRFRQIKNIYGETGVGFILLLIQLIHDRNSQTA